MLLSSSNTGKQCKLPTPTPPPAMPGRDEQYAQQSRDHPSPSHLRGTLFPPFLFFLQLESIHWSTDLGPPQSPTCMFFQHRAPYWEVSAHSVALFLHIFLPPTRFLKFWHQQGACWSSTSLLFICLTICLRECGAGGVSAEICRLKARRNQHGLDQLHNKCCRQSGNRSHSKSFITLHYPWPVKTQPSCFFFLFYKIALITVFFVLWKHVTLQGEDSWGLEILMTRFGKTAKSQVSSSYSGTCTQWPSILSLHGLIRK